MAEGLFMRSQLQGLIKSPPTLEALFSSTFVRVGGDTLGLDFKVRPLTYSETTARPEAVD